MTKRILKTDRRSLRLTLSYLAIIMVLCLGFSAIFYQATTGNLDLSLNSSGQASSKGTSDKGLSLQADGAGSSSVSLSGASSDLTHLDAQLRQQVQAIREGLLRRLAVFNLGALLTGTVVSYLLARRTLQPIEAAMEAQARFSSDASHELRTPLTALRARSEVTLRNPRLTLAEAKHTIKGNIEQVQKLEQITDGLLQLGNEDHRRLARHPVSLEEVANEAMNTVVTQAQEKHIIITETAPHVKVQADRQSLVQATTILLDNAIKYSDKGSTIYLEGTTEGSYGLLYVRDEGRGIDSSDLPHIFERFYRADASRSRQGHGLGLSIAQNLIERNNGRIGVESTVGKGSVFVIKLPLA